MSFKLHKKFLKSSHHITDSQLCNIRLNDNSKFPWLILIPKKNITIEKKSTSGFVLTVAANIVPKTTPTTTKIP